MQFVQKMRRFVVKLSNLVSRKQQLDDFADVEPPRVCVPIDYDVRRDFLEYNLYTRASMSVLNPKDMTKITQL